MLGCSVWVYMADSRVPDEFDDHISTYTPLIRAHAREGDASPKNGAQISAGVCECPKWKGNSPFIGEWRALSLSSWSCSRGLFGGGGRALGGWDVVEGDYVSFSEETQWHVM